MVNIEEKMTDSSALQSQLESHARMLIDARRHLNGAWRFMNEYKDLDPAMYWGEMRTFAGLSTQQAALEESFNQLAEAGADRSGSGGQLGNPILIGGVIVTGIIGLGTWAYQQFVASKNFDQYQQCLKEQEKLGIRGEQAARICSGKFPIIDISWGNLAGLALLALGLYFVFIKKK